MRNIAVSAIAFFLLFASANNTYSQSFLGWKYNDRYFSFNIGTGKSGYSGELSHGKLFQKGLSSVNFGLEARLYSRISARMEFTYYNISGADNRLDDASFEQQRNLSFTSDNFEYNLTVLYYFLNPYNDKYYKRKPIDPFFNLGIGLTYFNPKAELNGETYELRRYQTENVRYGALSFVVPVGIGAKLSLSEFINIIPEFGYRFVFSDYLDDVSGTFGGPYSNDIATALSNRKNETELVNRNAYDLMVPGGQRGDGRKMDKYYVLSLKLEAYIPPDIFSKRKNKEKIYKKPSAFDRK